MATNPQSKSRAQRDAMIASELGTDTGLVEQSDYMLVANQKNKTTHKKETTKKAPADTPKKSPKKT